MNKTQITLSAVTAAAVLVVTSTVAVSAAEKLAEQEFDAEQSQKFSWECKLAQYGDATCEGEGKQRQKISGKQVVYAPQGKVLGKTHTPVNTALDTAAMTAVFASGLLGIAAFAGYLKLSK